MVSGSRVKLADRLVCFLSHPRAYTRPFGLPPIALITSSARAPARVKLPRLLEPGFEPGRTLLLRTLFIPCGYRLLLTEWMCFQIDNPICVFIPPLQHDKG